MKLIHVIPISRGIFKESLSYFSAADIPDGTIITVPLRKKSIPALVIGSEDVSSAKSSIRSSRYQMRKVAARKQVRLFLPEFINAAKETARYYAGTTGAILHTILPKAIISNTEHLSTAPEQPRQHAGVVTEKLVLQAETEERSTHYKNIVREEFARNSSVFVCVPTIRDGERLFSVLRKGIEQHVFELNASLSQKVIRERWNAALTNSHPVLIIATGIFLCLPRADIGTIIVEREHSDAYKNPTRPYVSMRTFAEKLAEQRHVRVLFGDLPLSLDSIWRYRQGQLDEAIPIKVRTIAETPIEIIDMRRKERGKNFTIISNELARMIEGTRVRNEQMFLYTARRGLSPTTVCEDCGTPVMSEDSSTPMVLHKSSGGNIFISHQTGETRSATERCKNCDSWRLKPLGIGIERVADELKKLFPDMPSFIIDRDSVKSHKQALTVVDSFMKSSGSLLLGTEMALPYITSVAQSAVVSIDSLLSLPEWNIHEKVFSILLAIQEKTRNRMIVQTRKAELPVLAHAAKGAIADFYREEIKHRQDFGYPPVTTLIKITVEGSKVRVQKDMEEIKKKLKNYNFTVYSSLITTSSRRFVFNGLIKLQRDNWPNNELDTIMRGLPPSVTITVDPDRLL